MKLASLMRNHHMPPKKTRSHLSETATTPQGAIDALEIVLT
jgi:hypothetical protein